MRRTLSLAGVVVLVVAGAAVTAVTTAQQFDDLLKHAGQEWPVVYGDWGNTRYSTLDRINTSNIRNVGGAWVVPTQSAARSAIVREGVMFVTSGANVMAIDSKTGGDLEPWRRQLVRQRRWIWGGDGLCPRGTQ